MSETTYHLENNVITADPETVEMLRNIPDDSRRRAAVNSALSLDLRSTVDIFKQIGAENFAIPIEDKDGNDVFAVFVQIHNPDEPFTIGGLNPINYTDSIIGLAASLFGDPITLDVATLKDSPYGEQPVANHALSMTDAPLSGVLKVFDMQSVHPVEESEDGSLVRHSTMFKIPLDENGEEPVDAALYVITGPNTREVIDVLNGNKKPNALGADMDLYDPEDFPNEDEKEIEVVFQSE